MIKPAEAGALLAMVILVILILAWRTRRHHGPRKAHYCPGPHNITLYDSPYTNYPSYEGRGAVWWDGDRRCSASCQQSPCVVWCR
jgi:hypothetical protein